MIKINAALLIENDDVSSFISNRVLDSCGVQIITPCKQANEALAILKETQIAYQIILVDINLPMMNGFEFIDKFHELELHKTHGKICILSASINHLDRKKAADRNIQFIDKPLTIEKMLNQNLMGSTSTNSCAK